MMLGEISFAGKTGYNIKSDDVKQRLLDDLEGLTGFKVIQKHHDRFHDNLIHKLSGNPHLVCLKSNGNPYLLYLTRINFVNQCVFIDKKIQQGYFYPRMIMSRFRFDDRLFEGGTLIDGEMVKASNGSWIFLVGDIFGYQGMHLTNTNLVKRISMLYDLMKTQFVQEPCDVCQFQVKKYATYAELDTVLEEFMPMLPYTTRGIYFKPLYLKFKDILYNFDESLIVKVLRKKYKDVSNFLLETDKDLLDPARQAAASPPAPAAKLSKPPRPTPEPPVPPQSKPIRIYSVRKTSMPDVYEMTSDESAGTEVACLPTLRMSKYLRNIFGSKNVSDRICIKFEYSDTFNKWVPCCVA